MAIPRLCLFLLGDILPKGTKAVRGNAGATAGETGKRLA